MVLFAISQTSTFRNWFREKIVTSVNGSINGELSIERIDGTIFTSLILNNTILKYQTDTLLLAREIEVKASPLEILFRNIYFRKVSINDAKISLLKDNHNRLNISKLFKPSEEEKPDTSSSEFTFKIRVADLSLNSVDFKLQTYENKYSTEVYSNLNTDDIRLDNINLSMDLFANIAGKHVKFNIHNLSVNSNLSGFDLENLSGNFFIENDNVGVQDLNLVSSRTQLSLSAGVGNISIWGDSEINIEKAPMRLDLDAKKFDFDDLTNFIPATELLRGTVKTQLRARGTLNDLDVRQMDIGFNNTLITGNGNLKNITDGDRMKIDMDLSGSSIFAPDPDSLLRTINIPVYSDYGVLNFDTLYFQGEPLNFSSGLMVNTDKGEFDGVVAMDLKGEDMIYDIALFTQNLDLEPVINLPTNLNSHILLKGTGTSPESMINDINLTANWSEIKNRKYQRLNFKSSSKNGDLKYDLSFKTDSASGKISGDINFTDAASPAYNIEAELSNFNFADLIPGSDLESDINLNVSATGNKFDPDSLELFAVIGVDSSEIEDIELDGRKVIIDLRNDEESGRIINVVSNLADITVSGRFSILDIVALAETEATLITDFINHNLKKINPLALNTYQSDFSQVLLPDKSVDINYSVEFKDFELLSLLLGNNEMEIDGDINGLVKRDGDILTLSAILDVNYFKILDKNELYFLSGMTLSTELANDFSVEFPQSFNSSIELSVHELFLNEKIYDLNLNAKINHNNIDLSLGGRLDNFLTTKLRGNVLLGDDTTKIVFDSLFVMYNDFEVWSKQNVDIDFADRKFTINSFSMTHSPGDIDLSGFCSLTNDQNLILHINNLRGKELSDKILFLPPGTGFRSKIDLSAYLQGTFNHPLLDFNLSADSIIVQNKKMGTLITTASYKEDMLKFNLDILDTLYNIDAPILNVTGNIPIHLSSNTIDESDIRNMKFSLSAKDFDLTAITGVISPFKDLKGKLNGVVNATGTEEGLNFSGYAKINDVSFIANANNISYKAFASITFENHDINFDSIYVKNVDGAKNGGDIIGSGKIVYSNMEFADVIFHATGQLKVLGKETRAVNPTIYGDLTVKTNGNIDYISSKSQNLFKADLMIEKGADVTISRTQSAFSNSSDKFIYTYKKYGDSSIEGAIIDSLIVLTELKSRHEGSSPSKRNNLNLQVKLTVEDEAKVVFELAPEFKQNLTTYLDGSIEYNIISDRPVAQGELQLLEGSKLEFIKPFEATGTVKFFDKVDDPYLDIVATYNDYYSVADSTTSGTGEKEVQIRIKLQGPFSELDKNFAQQEGNITVYMRENNLSDFQLDPTKTPSDAIMFIILHKFTDDATSQDRNFAASTATSFAGSLAGALLNQAFGDYVRSVRFQQVGTETKVSLIGKAGDFKYEIGGTSNVFQDISRANIKIEYPVGNLVFRFQRREPLQGTTTYGEMINEGGVKYRFEF